VGILTSEPEMHCRLCTQENKGIECPRCKAWISCDGSGCSHHPPEAYTCNLCSTVYRVQGISFCGVSLIIER
jgi:hypothetical protein